MAESQPLKWRHRLAATWQKVTRSTGSTLVFAALVAGCAGMCRDADHGAQVQWGLGDDFRKSELG